MSLSERWCLLILVELLIITQWVEVWEVILVDIGGIVNHHSMSWSERWFLSTIPQYKKKSPLTLTHWVMVSNSTNIKKNPLSPQLIEWWLTIPPISTKITSYQWVEMRGDFCWYWWNCWPSLNELRCERWFWLILVELLTIIQWVEVRGEASPLTLIHWVMVNNSTNINKNHLSS
jgi:hypothetical protein